MAPRYSVRSRALAEGYRSGLEEQECARLDSLGIPYGYEPLVLPYQQPAKPRKYTPDIVLLKNGIVVETKGRFVTADRQKHILIQEQYPDLDLRFVFSNPKARISKQSKTTYAAWCESRGILYAAKTIPLDWIYAPANARSLALVQRLLKEKKK